MTTETKMLAMIADAISEDENGSFEAVGSFTESRGGPYIDFSGLTVWAADGTAFQITVVRDRRHDIKDSVEEELEGRISNLSNGAIEEQHNTFREGIQKGLEDAIIIYRHYKEAKNNA